MGCTKAEKDELGKEWIDKLQLSYECHDFHDQILKCHCIYKMSNTELAIIKAYFKNLAEIFWVDDHHVANRSNCDEIDTHFGHFSSSLLHLEFSEGSLSILNWREELLHFLSANTWPVTEGLHIF